MQNSEWKLECVKQSTNPPNSKDIPRPSMGLQQAKTTRIERRDSLTMMFFFLVQRETLADNDNNAINYENKSKQIIYESDEK